MKFALTIATLAVVASAHAFIFSLDPVTTVAQNAGAFTVNGSVTVDSGEGFSGWQEFDYAFLPDFSAGFNGNSLQVDAAFLSWNGVGTYTGAIMDFNTTDSTNYGYSGGMPVGLYNFNPSSVDLMPGFDVGYYDVTGAPQSVRQNFAINVVATPEPATMVVLGVGALAMVRRRRASK